MKDIVCDDEEYLIYDNRIIYIFFEYFVVSWFCIGIVEK